MSDATDERATDLSLRILVDADACPVKTEIYDIALRFGAHVLVVSNSGMRLPRHPLLRQVIVDDHMDAADDHIAEVADAMSVVITADIPLADRCLTAGALVLAPTGKAFTPDSIGTALATRAIMENLRAGGDQLGGPAPFTARDRSNFRQALDTALNRLKQKRDAITPPA